MSNAQIWAALQQSALVGVDRLAIPGVWLAGVDEAAAPTQQALQAALRAPAQSSAEQLLRASAVAAVMERAGWTPGQQAPQEISSKQSIAALTVAPPLAPAESRAAPTDERLQTLMREALHEGPEYLLEPMFHALDQAGQRLPHGLLVPALEQGRQSVELRAWLMPVLGERGRWLGSLNPPWRFASGVQERADPEVVWQEGSINQRVDLLTSERQTDPTQARARLEGSLKELSAKERVPMVQALAIGLAMEDEPLLEKLLNDRSKEVRESAARLLSALPDSAHSQRIAAWLRAMLTQDSKGEWQIEPPEEGLKDWERDGISIKPPSYIKGVKGWWLQQMVELSPLTFWMQALDKTPEQLWEWSKRRDWKTPLRQGWLAALAYQHDVRWLPLLQTMERDARAEPLLPALLARLTPAQREAIWRVQLERGTGRLVAAIEHIDSGLPVAEQLSPALSTRLLDVLYQAIGGKQATGNWYSYEGDHALLACARMLHVSVLSRLSDLWRQPRHADAVVPDGEAKRPLTPDQQDKLERAKRRPWDDVSILVQLDRTVDLRLALHAALNPAL